MFLKFICCDVFSRIACELVSKSPHVVDIEFIPMLAHVEPQKLKLLIREKIEKSVNDSGRIYDAIILGFGLCGNATVGLSSCVPLIIPRAHDCCTISMGSKENFETVFGNNLSARWSSTGYYERTRNKNGGYPDFTDQLANYKTTAEYMEYVEKYDEETADYLWETLHPVIESDESFYIKIDGFEYSDSYENYKAFMEKQDINLKQVDGNIALLKALVDGDWDDERFLTVPPGKKIIGVYDKDRVMSSGD